MNVRLDKSTALILCGLLAASVLIGVILLRYPGNATTRAGYLGLGLFGLLSMLGTAVIAVWLDLRLSKAEQRGDKSLGLIVGLIGGVAWVLEISFNNFVDPRVSTGQARFYVDNGFWAFVGMSILIASLLRAVKTRDSSSAIRVGVWSGLTSGLMACLMGLMLITVWMRFLLRDPLAVDEYAVRSIHEHLGNRPTYHAYEAMTGSILHLVLLGIGMGLLLGALGAVLAGGVRLISSRDA